MLHDVEQARQEWASVNGGVILVSRRYKELLLHSIVI